MQPSCPDSQRVRGFTPVQPVTGLASQAELTNDMALRATALLSWMMVLRALARLTLMVQSQYGRPSRRLSRASYESENTNVRFK